MAWWIGSAKSGREFEVRDAILALGAMAYVPRKIEALRRGKQRWAEAVESPVLPNYVFVDCTDDEWHGLRSVKHLSGTMLRVPGATVRSIQAFLDREAKAYAERRALYDAGERLSQYTSGDEIEIFGGPFAGRLATFRSMTQADGEMFPRLRAETEVMGRVVTFNLDPINVRKAG